MLENLKSLISKKITLSSLPRPHLYAAIFANRAHLLGLSPSLKFTQQLLNLDTFPQKVSSSRLESNIYFLDTSFKKWKCITKLFCA